MSARLIDGSRIAREIRGEVAADLAGDARPVDQARAHRRFASPMSTRS